MEGFFELHASYDLFPEIRRKHGCQISIVIPLFNEQDNVPHLLDAVRDTLKNFNYEIVAVDDGSTDNTVKMLKQAGDERLKVIVMTRNFGQTNAMAAGIAHASGEYIVTLDGDLQNDPADIPAMLDHARSGHWDIVAGYRANRLDGLLLRKLPSRMANAMIRSLTGVHLRDYGCTLKVFRREVAERLGLYGELHRFIPVLGNITGARMTEVPVRHHKRRFGKSKYGLGRTTRVLGDLLLMIYMQRWMKKPMHLFGALGGSLLAAGILLLLWQLLHLFSGTTGTLAGLALALSGIVIVLMGLIAEMLMRSYYEGSGKTPYTIREMIERPVEPATRNVHTAKQERRTSEPVRP
ncbi:glycosyltransferase family 2 protein [Dyadobacter fermentans]|jgi:glycosyltransferase involved in cell wall biosynthesis|uniref:glycosyltransferase family 2 protein n=1 Tax=Dyadobacter fermentans TaxID=94254 RepID=UPI001CC10944|nr:glycosyltransferase family 2 protein [Dyadobacter fermentans]MBZ1362639.1 glycosyltransferase family 2 protein [Dyadobacter fermentans]